MDGLAWYYDGALSRITFPDDTLARLLRSLNNNTSGACAICCKFALKEVRMSESERLVLSRDYQPFPLFQRVMLY